MKVLSDTGLQELIQLTKDNFISNSDTAQATTVQLATVATSGSYNDLSNKPTLGTAAAADTTDFATAAQGTLASTAVQPGDLATVATTGDYGDLLNKPTIPAAQVNSDWNAASGVAQILNKPTLGTMAAESASDYTPTSGLATVATTGNYSDLSGTPSLATVATSGSYNDLNNKPTIPTVNDATLTIQKNGTSVATFTANASSGVTANITVPTTTNDLTNNSGFITSSDIPVTDVTVGGTSVVTSGVAAVPAIPTVNDATITITQGGVTKGSFTLNQASGDTIALDAGGGSSLPSQTGHAGEFLTTDGTDASWSNKPLVNKAVQTYSCVINTNPSAPSYSLDGDWNVMVGYNASVGSSACEQNVIIGYAAGVTAGTHTMNVLVGSQTQSTAKKCVVVGATSQATADNAIQLGCAATNSDANTFKVANANGNFEIMSADGTIPEARLADTTSATQGQVLTLDSNLDAVWANAGGGSGYTPNIFDWKWADHELNDMSWLRADTFSWQDGTVYSNAYDHLADDISGKTLQTETVGGTTISFYLADDGHKICPATQESNVTAIYTATGVAWYYIIDTVNTRFKLPRTTALSSNIKGNGIALGLTNGTNNGALNNSTGSDNRFIAITNTYGSAVGTVYSSTTTAVSTTDKQALGITTDSTKSGIIVERASDTQHTYLYFYVGQFSQSAIEQTAGLNASLFNGKVDVGHQIIDFQEPNAGNNYTWYRKYADGWVEQGQSRVASADAVIQITFPVEMADTYYVWSIGRHVYDVTAQNTNERYMGVINRTTTGFNVADKWGHTYAWSWQVSGMAA